MLRKIIFGLSLILAFLLGATTTVALVGGINPSQGTALITQDTSSADANRSTTLPVSQGELASDPVEKIIIDVYERLAPSVVHITAVRQVRHIFYGLHPEEGTGSGVIISSQGYILTNNHVIKGAQEVTVRFVDGTLSEATLVGIDSFTDLAVIKVEKAIDPAWVVKLGDSDKLRVGQRAIAIGNPFGFDHTLSVGVISAIGRPIKTQEAAYEDMIQTDASINPGNSGGPLINSAGEVIGLNTGIFSRTGTSLGIGFSIPSNACRKVAEDLIEFGRVRRPYLGASAFALDRNLSRDLNLSVNYGLLVQSVAPESPAAKAGLKAGDNTVKFRYGFYVYEIILGGDIILALDGEPVVRQEQLTNKIKRMAPGDTITLSILRDGATTELEVELEIEP